MRPQAVTTIQQLPTIPLRGNAQALRSADLPQIIVSACLRVIGGERVQVRVSERACDVGVVCQVLSGPSRGLRAPGENCELAGSHRQLQDVAGALAQAGVQSGGGEQASSPSRQLCARAPHVIKRRGGRVGKTCPRLRPGISRAVLIIRFRLGRVCPAYVVKIARSAF
jgi:hypothetical protein